MPSNNGRPFSPTAAEIFPLIAAMTPGERTRLFLRMLSERDWRLDHGVTRALKESVRLMDKVTTQNAELVDLAEKVHQRMKRKPTTHKRNDKWLKMHEVGKKIPERIAEIASAELGRRVPVETVRSGLREARKRRKLSQDSPPG